MLERQKRNLTQFEDSEEKEQETEDQLVVGFSGECPVNFEEDKDEEQ